MPPERDQALATYSPGESSALAAQGFWLLADVAADASPLKELWQTLQYESVDRAAELTSTLITTGLLGQGFAVLRQIDEHMLVMVGGTAGAQVVRDERVDVFSCPQGVAVTEYRLPGFPDAIHLALAGDPTPATLPLGIGIAPAVCLQLKWGRRLLVNPPEAAATVTARLIEGADRQVRPLEKPARIPSISDETIDPPSISADTITSSMVATPSDEDDVEEGVAPSSAPEPMEGSEAGYDYLFGHTVHRSVTDAAVHAEAAMSTEMSDGTAVASAAEGVSVSGSESEVEPHSASAASASLAEAAQNAAPAAPIIAKSTGMIDAVPWTGPSSDSDPAVPEDKEPEPAGLGTDHSDEDDGAVGLTISRAKQKEILQRLSSDAGQTSPGPVVHAVRCPAGHPNPAHASECRICKEPIEDQSPVTLPRPILGVLRFSTGDVITLDRDVLIGRKPSPTRSAGNDRPHVVKLPSPEQDISRNHLEIRLDDWHVLVTDLNSTNGTVVTRPGREPERLRPDQAMMIEPGSVVDLAEVVAFTFDATD